MKKILITLLCMLILLTSFSAYATPGDKPTVSNITIHGIEKSSYLLSVSYDFNDPNGVDDNSDIIWEYSADGINFNEIPGAVSKSYEIDSAYCGKYIRVSVYPKNKLNIVGTLTHSSPLGPVLEKTVPDGMEEDASYPLSNQLDVIPDLQSLGIVDRVAESELRLDDTITRAEFAKLIAKLCNFPSASYNGNFADVTSEHWAASYISFLAQQKIFDGYSDGFFYPENNILMQEAAKIVVTVLGYKSEAAKGGYPAGYISMAGKLRLFDGVEAKTYETVATRKDVFTLIHNALDVNILAQSAIYANGDVNYSIIEGNTLRSHLVQNLEIMQGVGVVSATYDAFLLEPVSDIKVDEIEINGTRFKLGYATAQNLFGKRVFWSATKNAKSGEYILGAVSVVSDVDTITVSAEEYMGYSDFKLSYLKDGDKAAQIKISQNAAMLYNNRPATDWAQFDVKNGYINLIDNTGDGYFDIVLIYDYVSMPVKNVNVTSGQITFADDMYYKSLNKIALDLNNEYKQSVVCSSSGEISDISAINSGSTVSIFESAHGDYLKLVYSNTIIDGVVSEISDDGFVIDGIGYKSEQKEMLSTAEIRPGQTVNVYLNFEGKIAYIEAFSKEFYGYIIDTTVQGLASGKIYMLDAGSVETREEDADNDPDTDTTIKVMVAYNNGTKVLEMAPKCTVDDGYGSSYSVSNVYDLPKDQPLKYKLNSAGKLSRITLATPFDTTDVQRSYYALDNVFSGSYGEAFGIDNDTFSLCIPTNEVSDMDYMAETRVEDGRAYNIYAWDFDDTTSNAKLVTIHSEMKYNSSDAVGSTTKIAVLLNKSQTVNSDGDVTLKLKFLTNGITNEMEAADYADISRLNSLNAGDVFYYSQNKRHQIVDCEKVESLSNLGVFYNTGRNCYGMINSLEFGRISVILNRRTFNVYVQTDSNNPSRLEHFEVQTTNAPPIFIYNKRLNTVTYGDAENLKSYDAYGSGADKVFIHLNQSGRVECIAVIQER